MSRIMQEPKRHIHESICSEVNEMVIRLKIWDAKNLDDANDDQREKILKARQRIPYATSADVTELMERVRDEMNQCTEPYRRF